MRSMPFRPPTLRLPQPTDHAAAAAPPVTWASLWAATGGWQSARGQSANDMPSRVVELRGDVLRNGARIGLQDAIAAGDRLETGPGSRAVLTVGDSAFLVCAKTPIWRWEAKTPLRCACCACSTGPWRASGAVAATAAW